MIPEVELMRCGYILEGKLASLTPLFVLFYVVLLEFTLLVLKLTKQKCDFIYFQLY